MDMKTLNKVCFTVCVLCIMAGVVLALAMIWTPALQESLWRGLATVGVVFLGSSSVLSLSRTFGGRGDDDPRPGDGPDMRIR